MHIIITLSSIKGLELPIHYNHILQGVIYKNIDTELACFLHEQGYQNENRTFKMYSYSRLNGFFKINKEDNIITFSGDIKWTVSSPVINFCESIANGLLMAGQIQLGKHQVEVQGVDIQQSVISDGEVVLKSLSPIVVYSTLFRADGHKYTCYYQPDEPDYDRLIEQNLRKKYQALYGCEAPIGNIKVRKIGQMKMNIINYKGTIIKGYSGTIIVTGPKELLQIGLDGGLGAKNGQGFGCVQIVRKK